MHKVKMMKQFLPIIQDNYSYYVYYGGRGGGKTENIAIAIILLAVKNPNWAILCVREVLKTLEDSSKAMIEKWVRALKLEHRFKFTRESIVCDNGTRFIFRGLRDSNAEDIKSIVDVKACWIEEGASITYNSWIKLNQSITRYDPKIIISFNPENDFDCIYDYFLVRKPPENTFICKINYTDNPFFKGSSHEKLMLHEKETMDAPDFAHFWEGETLSKKATALWNYEIINKMSINDIYTRNNYIKLIISCDPATTSHSYSNEYGIIVAGLRANAQIDIIADFGGIYTPFDFGRKVAELYEYYEADSVVVEDNQGGEHLRQTIVAASPLIVYERVWSSNNKIMRAMPVATLCDSGRVKMLVKNCDFTAISLQMRQMTTDGFIGARGSSPDRVDAMVWAVSNLAGLKKAGATNTLYQPSFFTRDSRYGFLEFADLGFVGCVKDEMTILKYSLKSTQNCEKAIIITDCIITQTGDFDAIKELDLTSILLPNMPQFLNYDGNALVYEPSKDDLVEMCILNIGFIRQNKIQFEPMPFRSYNNESGELLRQRTANYINDKQHAHDSCILAINELINYYYN